jgi:hypothetical protein
MQYNRSSHGYEELLVSLQPDIPQQDANIVLGSQSLLLLPFPNLCLVLRSGYGSGSSKKNNKKTCGSGS